MAFDGRGRLSVFDGGACVAIESLNADPHGDGHERVLVVGNTFGWQQCRPLDDLLGVPVRDGAGLQSDARRGKRAGQTVGGIDLAACVDLGEVQPDGEFGDQHSLCDDLGAPLRAARRPVGETHRNAGPSGSLDSDGLSGLSPSDLAGTLDSIDDRGGVALAQQWT